MTESFQGLMQAIKKKEVDVKAGRGYGEFSNPQELAQLRIRAALLKAVGLPEEQFVRVLNECGRVAQENGIEIEGEDYIVIAQKH